MSRKSAKFRPPKVSDPPDLVEVEWIDAQGDNESDLPAHQSGGLVQLPRGGYYVRHASKGPHGPFVVIAAEHLKNGDVTHVRDHISIPVGWITRWSVVTGKRQVWPASEESATSTYCIKVPRSSPMVPSGTLAQPQFPTISSAATSAGASLNPSISAKTPSS